MLGFFLRFDESREYYMAMFFMIFYFMIFNFMTNLILAISLLKGSINIKREILFRNFIFRKSNFLVIQSMEFPRFNIIPITRIFPKFQPHI